jgi:hypothetical protein
MKTKAKWKIQHQSIRSEWALRCASAAVISWSFLTLTNDDPKSGGVEDEVTLKASTRAGVYWNFQNHWTWKKNWTSKISDEWIVKGSISRHFCNLKIIKKQNFTKNAKHKKLHYRWRNGREKIFISNWFFLPHFHLKIVFVIFENGIA